MYLRIAIAVITLSLINQAKANTAPDLATDSAVLVQNKAKELASVQAKQSGFVAIPVPIANPTVGTGLQAAFLYLHPNEQGDTSLNDTSGLGLMYTDSQSWMVGVFHDAYWADGKYRGNAFAAYGDMNLHYFGSGDTSSDTATAYNFKASMLGGQIQTRLPRSKAWFLGTRYRFINSFSEFESNDVLPGLPAVNFGISTASLGLIATLDSRDDNYYPSSGSFSEIVASNYGAKWGGDFEYNKFSSFISHYQTLNRDTILALKLDYRLANGEVPFFDEPSLKLRGLAFGQYQNNQNLSIFSEIRHKFSARWGMVAFIESGVVGGTLPDLSQQAWVYSYGLGARWQATATKKLNLRVDAAKTQLDTVLIVSVGEAF